MEDNRTSIKKRLDDIFIEKMGYLVNRLVNVKSCALAN